MQSNWWNWSGPMAVLVTLLLLATGGGTGRAGAPQGKTDPPKPLSEKIITAWKEAGAEVGWMRANPYGFLEFVPGQAGKPGDVPAFRFRVWQAGRLAKLPAPAAALGLDLGGTPQVTDAVLKELAGLKSSCMRLDPSGRTEVTDAGLKELAGLKSLHTLFLNSTEVTDAGLKEIAGLKSLHTLVLESPQVTNAGLMELAVASRACTRWALAAPR